MAEHITNEVVKTKAVKRKIGESEDDLAAAGSSKIAKTETKTEQKPAAFNPKEIIAKYYSIKVQEIIGELLNPLKEDFDAPATLKRLEYYVAKAKEKAKIAGIPCTLEFKTHLW